MSKIVVVEGTHDEALIKQVFKNQACVVTNGSEISKETLAMIKSLSFDNEIIIFTDPDHPGEKIRARVHEEVPNAIDCFIKKNDCISKNKKKVGVEHASKEEIATLLGPYLNNDTFIKGNITRQDIIALGLTGANSAKLREEVSLRLNIGRPNAKTFLNRLNMLGLSYQKLKEIVGEING